MKKNTVRNARFTIDFIEGKIIGTKASFDQAGKGSGPIYKELAAKVKAHPGFVLAIKEQTKHSSNPKRTYKGLNFSFMERYIKIQEESDRLTKEYNSVKKFAEDSGFCVFSFTKKWFLKEFGDEEAGFDMEKGVKEITDAAMKAAVQAASPVPVKAA